MGTNTVQIHQQWILAAVNHNIQIAMQDKKYFEKGITLIELIISLGTISILLTLATTFFFTLTISRIKNQTITEVEQQGAQVMQLIVHTIRNAEAINTPIKNISSSSLSLDVTDVIDDPTVFNLENNIIHITEGSNFPVQLTNTRIVASDLSFYNLSRNTTGGTIHIEFTLTHINQSGRNEYNYTKLFYGGATAHNAYE